MDNWLKQQSIENVRKWYASEIKYDGNITDERVLEAFAQVPRENFLGKGPWGIVDGVRNGKPYYWKTEDADPRHIYHNILIGLDESRGLNNGQPSFQAKIAQLGNPQPGESVVHVGCGVGYYTAIWTELVGPSGRVLGLEVEKELAERARHNLSNYENVAVLAENGVNYPKEKVDVIFINAGVTHLQSVWLDNLRVGGRILAPFVTKLGGQILRVTKEVDCIKAEFVMSAYIYRCEGGYEESEEEMLRNAIEKKGADFAGYVRRDQHNIAESCWLHRADYCLSTVKSA